MTAAHVWSVRALLAGLLNELGSHAGLLLWPQVLGQTRGKNVTFIRSSMRR
jgi:hypothetical protein